MSALKRVHLILVLLGSRVRGLWGSRPAVMVRAMRGLRRKRTFSQGEKGSDKVGEGDNADIVNS